MARFFGLRRGAVYRFLPSTSFFGAKKATKTKKTGNLGRFDTDDSGLTAIILAPDANRGDAALSYIVEEQLGDAANAQGVVISRVNDCGVAVFNLHIGPRSGVRYERLRPF
jgi:hypothetical protein